MHLVTTNDIKKRGKKNAPRSPTRASFRSFSKGANSNFSG